MNIRLKWAIALIGIITAGSVLLNFYCSYYPYLQAGQMIILAITLVVIIIYAWDTRRIANATELKWEEELKPKLMYEMTVDQSEQQSKLVYFRLINPTDYIIDATVNCNFKIYGEPISYPGAYDGSETWTVFPHQISQGYFSIDALLSQKGKSREQMIQEQNTSNASEQLTMHLAISFESETGRTRSYPARKHYFAFDKWTWVPELTKRK